MLSHLQAKSSVLVAGLLWASAGVIGAQFQLSSLALAEFRLVMAGTVLTLFLLTKKVPLYALAVANRRPLLLAAVGMAGFQWSFFFAVQTTNASFATWASVATGPLWACLIQSGLGPTIKNRGLDFGCAAAGLTWIALTYDFSAPGVLSSIIAGLCYALYAGSVRQISIAGGKHPEADINLISTGLALLGSAVVLLPCAVPELADFSGTKISLGDCIQLLMLGMLSTAVAYLLLAHGMRHLSAEQALRLQWVQPVATEAFAYVFNDALPAPDISIGMGLVLLSLLNLPRQHWPFCFSIRAIKLFFYRV